MVTDDELLRGLSHRQLKWNCPLSESRAGRLLSSLRLTQAVRIIDLGCGWGELVLRALTRSPGLTAVGVDLHLGDLERARSSAATRGLTDRVQFVNSDVVGYAEIADRVICVGADHAWGGVGTALSALHRSVSSDGLLLFGCGYWTQSPSAKLIEMFGDLPRSTEELVSLARTSRWDVALLSSADTEEWDEFESTWNRDLDDLASGAATPELRNQAARLRAQRREEYEHEYRGVLGFAFLTLTKSQTIA